MKNQNKGRRYTTEEIHTVVDGILNGRLWLEEAMEMFDIKSKRTVSSWLIKYLQGGVDSKTIKK